MRDVDMTEPFYGHAEIASVAEVPAFVARACGQVPDWVVAEVAWREGIYATGEFRGTKIYDKPTAARLLNAVNGLSTNEWKKLVSSTITTIELESQ